MKFANCNYGIIFLSAILLFTAISLSSCAGREPRPVETSQPGDYEKSCDTLNSEMKHLDEDILERFPKADKTGTNVGLGIAGAFLLVPWFFMDFSKADEIEISALIQRHNHLLIIAQDKGCDTERERIPTLEEMKKQAKEAQATKQQTGQAQ